MPFAVMLLTVLFALAQFALAHAVHAQDKPTLPVYVVVNCDGIDGLDGHTPIPVPGDATGEQDVVVIAFLCETGELRIFNREDEDKNYTLTRNGEATLRIKVADLALDSDRDRSVSFRLVIRPAVTDPSTPPNDRGVGILRIVRDRRPSPYPDEGFRPPSRRVPSPGLMTPAVVTLASTEDPCGTAFFAEHDDVDVYFDRTGVATIGFLNPRRPMYLGPPECTPQLNAEQQRLFFENRALLLHSRTLDRTQVLTISDVLATSRAEFEILGFELTSCKPIALGHQEERCVATVRLDEGADLRLPLRLLWQSFSTAGRGLVIFRVHFFEEDTSPANQRGYFTMVGKPDEPIEPPKLTASGSISVARDLDLADLIPADGKPAVIQLPFTGPDGKPQPGATRDGTQRSRVGGSTVLGIFYPLGTRATGEFEMQLKDGDFGQDPSVKATKYRVSVNSANGLVFSGGKFDVMIPSYGIAMRETGEAITASHPFANLLVAAIIRKELPRDRYVDAAPKDPVDRDHWAVAAQASPWVSLKDRNDKQWGQVSLFGVEGRQVRQRPEIVGEVTHRRQFTRHYRTIGSELGATWGLQSLTASIFWSETHGAPPAGLAMPGDQGSGTVSLIAYNVTKLGTKVVSNRKEIFSTFSAFYGRGTGDRAAQPGERDDNEGYIGETGNFAPDVIFLTKLAPFVNTTERTLVEGKEVKKGHGQVGRGLTNKQYVGGAYVDRRWSPLMWLAKGLGVADDVISKSTTLKLHTYRFIQPVFGSHDGGTELDVDFKLESPRAITYTVTGAYYWRGAALHRLITADQWLMMASASFKM